MTPTQYFTFIKSKKECEEKLEKIIGKYKMLVQNNNIKDTANYGVYCNRLNTAQVLLEEVKKEKDFSELKQITYEIKIKNLENPIA